MPDRVAALIHHITTLREPDELGVTRIAKILWLSDVEYYRQTGSTITGSDDYIKDEYGPLHRDFYTAIESLKRQGDLVERKGFALTWPRRELIPMTKPDVDEFSGEQIAIVDRITAAVAKMSAKQASDLTHDGLYHGVIFNERIPVAAGAVIEGEMTPEILSWAESVFDADSATG